MATSTLQGKSIIVTGGASGIGLGLVRFLASQSTKITILDISPSSESILPSLRTEFPSTTFTFKKCDITDWEEQKRVFGEVYAAAGRIDIVCANAGVTEMGSFLARDEEEPVQPVLRTLDINLVGNLYTIKLAIHYMRKNTEAQKGSIICTASQAGIYPFPVAPMYGSSKHGVVGAVKSLAKPLKIEGIRINAICPNVVATGIADNRLFSTMTLTPMSTVVHTVRELVTNTELTGALVEISGDQFTFREQPDWVDEISKSNFEQFWALGYA